MPTIKDTAATSALNEDKYINKLYDTSLGSQQKLLNENYQNNQKMANAGQAQNQALTDAYLQRTKVEAPGVNNSTYRKFSGQGGGIGTEAQAGLSFGNQQQRNVSVLSQQQAQADAEYNRIRKQLADQYSAEIKKAQADNDMYRAQQLYEAAKAEEDQLRELRRQGANLMAEKDDMGTWESIANGAPVQRDTTGETWDGVLKNEDPINKIYDAMLEGQRIEAGADRDRVLAELEAARQKAQRETDGKLNQLYTESMRNAKNAMETQNAYGQSSGMRDQSMMARANQLTGGLTDLRKLGQAQDLELQGKKLDAVKDYGSKLYSGMSEAEQKRIKALYGAAEDEEQNLIKDQETYGKLLAAKDDDYSILGKLYGLTEEQIKNMASSGGGNDEGGGGYRRGGNQDDGMVTVDIPLTDMVNSGTLTAKDANTYGSSNKTNYYTTKVPANSYYGVKYGKSK